MTLEIKCRHAQEAKGRENYIFHLPKCICNNVIFYTMKKKTLERQLILQRYLIIKVILKQTLSPFLKTDVWQNSPSLEPFLFFKVL